MDENIIDVLYRKLPTLSATDKKIAQAILKDPAQVVNVTISQLAKTAQVSDASVSRFCRNLGLAGFHQLKIRLAQVSEDKNSYYQQVDAGNLQQALKNIATNKIAEITNTLGNTNPATVTKILKALQAASLVQVAGADGTYPVAADAVYKFNQLGILTIASESYASAVAQTMNLPQDAVLLVISNSGETRDLLQQIAVAQEKGVLVIAITNRPDSPIGLKADLQLTTAVRQKILQSEYFFSRVAAMTAIEALFLLLLSENKAYLSHIKAHEALVANTKI